MTTKQFIEKQNKVLDSLFKENKPLLIAVKSIMAVQSKRIFLDGKNASGSVIGKYSKKPIYVNPDNLPVGVSTAFPLKGKTGKSKFDDGTSHVSAYFPNYLAFKKKIGRNKRISSVDLILSGALNKDWSNSEVVNGEASAKKINPSHYVVAISEVNAKKAERYGNVFGLQKREKQLFLNVLQDEVGKLMRNDSQVA